MFKVGDKVVPNGFKAFDGDYKYGNNPIKSEWEERSQVLTVKSVEEYNCITVSDGSFEYNYHPSELRIATEKEIKTLNETEEQKFEFNFGNNFYVLELESGTNFIATYKDIDDDICGLSDKDDTNSSCINEDDIKKIIAIIPKR